MSTSEFLQWIAAIGGVTATLTGLAPLFLARRARMDEAAERLDIRVRQRTPQDLLLEIYFEPEGLHDALVLSLRARNPSVRLAGYNDVAYADDHGREALADDRFARSGAEISQGFSETNRHHAIPPASRVAVVLAMSETPLQAARLKLTVRSKATGRRLIATKIAVSASS